MTKAARRGMIFGKTHIKSPGGSLRSAAELPGLFEELPLWKWCKSFLDLSS